MKPKSGTQRLFLFLVSVSFCTSLFSQKENYLTQPASNTTFAGSGTIRNFAVITPTSFSVKDFPKLHLSVADTIRKKDRDGDGIPDSLDKCPDEWGVIQYDGCPVPDSDNDGIPDDSDACPTTAGLTKYKGCPIPDSDGDKINDEDDKCPNQPGVARYDGCPVGDRDGDGVNDDDDKCIDIPGTINNAGCPENKKGTISSTKENRKKKGR